MTLKKTISLEGKNFQYSVRKSARAKRLKIIISADGELVAALPEKYDEKTAEDFMKKKSSWIISTIKKIKNNSARLEKIAPIESLQSCKNRAEKFLSDRLAFHNAFYRLEYKQVFLKQMKRNWGSCTSKKTLNFNYLIYFLPPEISDYIIVHELCHLKEMNHSPRFWTLVAKTIPDYKRRRKKLKYIVY